MVSVKRASLPREYIYAAKKLIDALEGGSWDLVYPDTPIRQFVYRIDYAFFYLRYNDDQEWYDGSWWLLIATEDLYPDQRGTRTVLDLIKALCIDLPEFEFSIVKPDENHKQIYDRVDIKAIN